MTFLRQYEKIHTMSRDDYGAFALEQFNADHPDDFMTGACDLESFKSLWDNHHSMNELENGDTVFHAVNP